MPSKFFSIVFVMFGSILNLGQFYHHRKSKGMPEKPLVLRWAFFPTASEVVLITHVNSPDYFHVTLQKFSKQLDQLELDLKKYIQDTKVKKGLDGPPELEKVFIYRGNDNCARVQVLDNSGEDEILVFFVDSGLCKMVKVENLFPIPRNLIEVLPFQAIECAFNNILPLNEDWDRDATEYLRRQILLNETCSPQPFFIIPFLKGESDYTGKNLVVIFFLKVSTDLLHKCCLFFRLQPVSSLNDLDNQSQGLGKSTREQRMGSI